MRREFQLTNLAILVLLGLVLSVLQAFGIALPRGGMGGLLVFAAVFGFGGAFISLLLSKPIAKWTTGAQVLTNPGTTTEQWLVARVKAHAATAGIGMPDVAIYDAPEINAFATGWNRNSALVAVSTGLLDQMSQDEADAVLAHEVSHIANGDMVTMALLQGVLNTFVIVLARLIGGAVDKAISGGESDGRGVGYFVTVLVLELALGLFASIIVAAFSRRREYRADAGGAQLAGRASMIQALERLATTHGESTLPDAVRAFGIEGKAHGLASLFRTHPPLADRIQALRQAA